MSVHAYIYVWGGNEQLWKEGWQRSVWIEKFYSSCKINRKSWYGNNWVYILNILGVKISEKSLSLLIYILLSFYWVEDMLKNQDNLFFFLKENMLSQNTGCAMKRRYSKPILSKNFTWFIRWHSKHKIICEIAAYCLRIFGFLNWLVYCRYTFNLKGKIFFGVNQTIPFWKCLLVSTNENCQTGEKNPA